MYGKILLITGISGGGKTTLTKEIRKKHPSIFSPISVTTREPRLGEENGIHYNFIDLNKFNSLKDSNQLLIFSEAYGNHYGLIKQPIIDKLDIGEHVLFETVVEATKNFKYSNTKIVFLTTPSAEIQQTRLIQRGMKGVELEGRLKDTEKELEWAHSNNIPIVINEKITETIIEIEKIFEI